MANTIELATIFNTVLDATYEQEAVTNWMEKNASGVDFVDGKYVKIPQITMSGYGTLERGGDYPTGTVAVTNKQYEMTQDRAIKLKLDLMDQVESKQVASGSNVIAQFARTQAIPEKDAYRHATIFKYANAAKKTKAYVPDSDTIYGELVDNIKEVQSVIGENYPLVIHMGFDASSALQKASEITKMFTLNDDTMTITGKDGKAITTKVKSLDGIPIKRVVSSRMYTSITMNDGTGETPEYGYATNDFSMKINWLIMAMDAPVGVTKLTDMKIIPASANPTSREDLIIPNEYHDLWVFGNKVNGLYVSYQAIDAPALTGVLEVGAESSKTKFTATAADGNTLGYKVSATALTAVPKLNQILTATDYTAYTSGADITAEATNVLYIYELDANKRVIRLYSKVLEATDIAE